MTARLEVIVGPMFSGKTELLIARLHRALYARKRIRIIKPAHDTRTQGFIAARAVNPDGTTEITDKLSAVMVRTEEDFARVAGADDYDVLAVDEAQFFPLDEPMRDSLGWFGRAVRDLMRERRESNLRIIAPAPEGPRAHRVPRGCRCAKCSRRSPRTRRPAG